MHSFFTAALTAWNLGNKVQIYYWLLHRLFDQSFLYSPPTPRSQGDRLNCVREGRTETHTLETNTQGGISASPLQLTDRHPFWNAVKCRSFCADGRPLLKDEYFKPLLYNHQATKIQNSNDENQMWVSYSSSMTTGLLSVGNDLFDFRREVLHNGLQKKHAHGWIRLQHWFSTFFVANQKF